MPDQIEDRIAALEKTVAALTKKLATHGIEVVEEPEVEEPIAERPNPPAE